MWAEWETVRAWPDGSQQPSSLVGPMELVGQHVCWQAF